jgi:ankyrin repeat protein
MTSILELLKEFRNNAKALLNKGVNAKDECGRTALMRAAHHGSADNVKILLDMGADVNLCDLWDVTALIMATARGRDDIVLLLREAGAKE